MPLPVPRKNEMEGDFISRCLGDGIMKEEYPDVVQRTAVCYSQWRKKKPNKNPKKRVVSCN